MVFLEAFHWFLGKHGPKAGHRPASRDTRTFFQPLPKVSGKAQGSSAPGRPARGTYKQGHVYLNALAIPSITREKGYF